MLRLIVYLLLLAPIIYGALWLAEYPGSVMIEWRGYEIRMALSILAAMIVLGTVIVLTFLLLLRTLLGTPRRLRERRKLHRYEQALGALNHTMTALALNDYREADRQLNKSRYYLKDNPPVTRLLGVQLAHATGKEADARAEFDQMLEDQTTRPVALRGKIRELMHNGERVHARDYAEEAWRDRPDDHWLAMVLLDIYFREHDWQAADNALTYGRRKGSLTREQAAHYRAMLLVARAHAAFDAKEYKRAQELSELALKRQSNLLAAQLILSHSFAKQGERKSLQRQIERGWAQSPHPFLAELFMTHQTGDTPAKTRKRLDQVVRHAPDHIESHLLRARVAMRLADWDSARNALKLALSQSESPRIYEQMAELETSETGDDKQASHWLAQAVNAPRDFSWTCSHCSHMHEHWQVHCQHCGQFDAVEWSRPDEHHTSNETLPA